MAVRPIQHCERAQARRTGSVHLGHLQPAARPLQAQRIPQAEIRRDRHGNPEPDKELRDTETVPLNEDIDAYMAREVLPHVPDAWVDHAKTKTGYEIPLNRHFYVYEPPRTLEEIDADLQKLEHEIVGLLAEITE